MQKIMHIQKIQKKFVENGRSLFSLIPISLANFEYSEIK